MTWREEAARIIHIATRDLPPDLPLAKRKRIVDAARPPDWDGTSWPRKAWQAARRNYLVKFGYVPKTKKALATIAAGMPLFDQSQQNHSTEGQA
ncbi:hypothetical protein [Paracoccus sp. KR1-242]|uniref:hypothetical protein n=1 Tax=Paracoccus sp. KR1-242 TaxID=3410028 RepID=UPI003BFB60A8